MEQSGRGPRDLIGFIPHAPREAFVEREWDMLLRHGRALSDLIAGVRQPTTPAQEGFARRFREGVPVAGEFIDLWQRYLLCRQTPLTVELVPRTSWFTNVRSAVSPATWGRLRRQAYRAAGNRCEVCGGRGPRHPVEAHEVFEYDDSARVQRLVRLTALCPACHGVKHIGLSEVRGRLAPALRHLARVNGWTQEDAGLYVEAQFEVWARRSRHAWVVDLSWLAGQGVDVAEISERGV